MINKGRERLSEMEINEYTVEKLVDPTGVITGDRYEFRLYIMLDEEDELYAEGGTGIRTIFAVDQGEERIAMAHFFKRETEEILPFELEEEELASILAFCKLNFQ